MNVELIREILVWSLTVNAGILLLWIGMIGAAGDFIYRVHGKFFKHLTRESFDAIHYGSMVAFKMAVVLFNGVPLVAMWLAGW